MKLEVYKCFVLTVIAAVLVFQSVMDWRSHVSVADLKNSQRRTELMDRLPVVSVAGEVDVTGTVGVDSIEGPVEVSGTVDVGSVDDILDVNVTNRVLEVEQY